MSKRFTFASPRRGRAVLCCAVAVLLGACGGVYDETDGQQSLAVATASGTAISNAGAGAAVGNAATQPAAEPALPAAAAPTAGAAVPTPADTTVVSETPAAAGEGSATPAAGEFNLSGYQQVLPAGSAGAGNDGTAAAGAGGQPTAQPLPPY